MTCLIVSQKRFLLNNYARKKKKTIDFNIFSRVLNIFRNETRENAMNLSVSQETLAALSPVVFSNSNNGLAAHFSNIQNCVVLRR